jgi:hypothetical protein
VANTLQKYPALPSERRFPTPKKGVCFKMTGNFGLVAVALKLSTKRNGKSRLFFQSTFVYCQIIISIPKYKARTICSLGDLAIVCLTDSLANGFFYSHHHFYVF